MLRGIVAVFDSWRGRQQNMECTLPARLDACTQNVDPLSAAQGTGLKHGHIGNTGAVCFLSRFCFRCTSGWLRLCVYVPFPRC